MSFYDEVQMQVTKTVQNVPLLHGHWNEVVKALVHRTVDDALLQTLTRVNHMLLQIVNVLHLRPINMVLHYTPHLVVNRVEVRSVVRSQFGSSERQNFSL